MKTPPHKRTKRTKQREVILKVLRNTKSHPNAFWIYEQVRKEIPKISLGTIYRNLNLLRDKGEILELYFSRPFSRFDGNTTNHYHFICHNCELIFDLDEPVDKKLDRKIAQKTGFKISLHRLEFQGLCPNCQKSD